jgi:hypothetical protein
MSRTIFLDTGPMGVLTNPKRPPETVAALGWAIALMSAGHRLMVPAMADYQVRRELERAGKTAGIATLDAWNGARPDRYLPLSDSALRLASRLWARARNAGTPTGDPKDLDCDVLIAAQTLDTSIAPADLVIATVNVGHLSLFVPADLWTNIVP